MAVKNSVFRENWVGINVASMKTTFFLPFLCQHGPTFCPQKAQIRNSLNNILVKKDRNYIIINFVTLRLTKVKFLKICFLPFLTQIGQKFGASLNILQMWHLQLYLP